MSLEQRMWEAAGLATDAKVADLLRAAARRLTPNLCEVDHRDQDGGLHPCGRPAGHAGDHVCALDNVCRATWGRVEVVVADHLGPCQVCSDVVRPGAECSECLEDDGVVMHGFECAQWGHR